MRYGMIIDLKKCIGCQACATSCKLANNLPSAVWWNTVHTDGGDYMDTAAGEYPNCTLQHYSVACQQCKTPSCYSVCPTGATYIDEETGVVLVDAEACIGCKACMDACPYDVRVYIDGEPKYAVDFAVGYQDAPKHLANTVGKCTLCLNLVNKNQDPMCVQACVGYARFFGDFDDPESEVSKMIAEKEVMQFLADMGTEPSVYYVK